jgi:hypothetical protein
MALHTGHLPTKCYRMHSFATERYMTVRNPAVATTTTVSLPALQRKSGFADVGTGQWCVYILYPSMFSSLARPSPPALLAAAETRSVR